jgi:hypothetical protein
MMISLTIKIIKILILKNKIFNDIYLYIIKILFIYLAN